MATPIFDDAHSKTIETTVSFPEFPSTCKKSVHCIYPLLSYSQFKSPMTRLATPTTISTQKNFDQLLINVNFCQLGKNQAISLICSEDTVD